MRVKRAAQVECLLTALLLGSLIAQATPACAIASNDYALLVGVSSYREGSPGKSETGIPALPYSKTDVALFNRLLDDSGVQARNRRSLLDGEATARAIREGLVWLIRTAQPESTVFFYFSGHGCSHIPDLDSDEAERERNDFFDEALLPYDAMDLTSREPSELAADAKLSDRFFATIVLDDEISSFAAECPGRVVIIVDACFSGGTLMSAGNTVDGLPILRTKGTEIVDEPAAALLLKSVSAPRWTGPKAGRGTAIEAPLDCVFMSACSDAQLALTDDRLKASWFTYHLCSAAGDSTSADLNRDREVSLAEAFLLADKRVRKKAHLSAEVSQLLLLAGRDQSQQPSAHNLDLAEGIIVRKY